MHTETILGLGGVFEIKRLTNDTQLVPGSEDPT